VGDPTTGFWDRTYREDPDFFGAGASSLARSSLGLLQREAAGGMIVELGCGTGRDLSYFAQHGFEVAGCDTSGVAVREANLRLSALRGEVPPRGRVTCRDALPYLDALPKGRVDAVFSHFYFNQETESARLPKLFHAIARVLRPEGLHLFAVRSTRDEWYGRGTPRGGDVFDPGGGNPPLRFFDETTVRRLASEEFTILALREHPDGGPEFPVVIWSAVTRRVGASPSRP
jgi:SAM-dependent methyltransferase